MLLEIERIVFGAILILHLQVITHKVLNVLIEEWSIIVKMASRHFSVREGGCVMNRKVFAS